MELHDYLVSILSGAGPWFVGGTLIIVAFIIGFYYKVKNALGWIEEHKEQTGELDRKINAVESKVDTVLGILRGAKIINGNH